MDADLEVLAGLLRQRNAIEGQIAALIGRPAHPGHVGEHIAAKIFDIALHPSASAKASDGYFQSGPLTGRSVNIKYGTRRDGMLNLSPSLDPSEHADLYLVLTGPTIGAVSSMGLAAPLVVHAAYCFSAANLLAVLTAANRRPGIATSLRSSLWDATRTLSIQSSRYPRPSGTSWPSSAERKLQYSFLFTLGIARGRGGRRGGRDG